MNEGDFLSVRNAKEKTVDYDFGESYRVRVLTRQSEEQNKEKAVQKVGEAKDANTRTTLEMMDRHNEMVEKSQKLREQKIRKDAIERQNQKRREEHSELLKEMALRSAERRDLLEAARLKEQG